VKSIIGVSAKYKSFNDFCIDMDEKSQMCKEKLESLEFDLDEYQEKVYK